MKSIILFIFIFLFFVACKTETKVYPDISADQIGKTVMWDMNYAQVKKVLTEDFKLDFSKEIKQSEKNQIGRVYEFVGGKFNGVDTKNWIVILEYDSLIILQIKIENDNPQKIFEFKNQLTSVLKPDSNSSSAENKWIDVKDGKTISNVQILTDPENKGIAITYFKPFPKKY